MNKESNSDTEATLVAKPFCEIKFNKDEESEPSGSSNISIAENDLSLRFGQYLSNEYELLKRTLSYLTLNDLLSCAGVSKAWLDVSLKILRRKRKLSWFVKPKKKEDASRLDLKFEIDSTSQLVLGIQKYNNTDLVLKELMQDRSFYLSSDLQSVLAEGPSIPGLSEQNMLILHCYDTTIPFCCNNEIKYLEHAAAGIFFPCLDGLNIDVKSFSCNEKSFPILNEALKGVLIFCVGIKFAFLRLNIGRFLDLAPNPVALGGGMIERISIHSSQNTWNSCEVMTISFHGENVTCHSDVLEDVDTIQVEKFFTKLKQDLGPYDVDKQRRIAIAIRCAERKHIREEVELYKKYFPNVPTFTVFSGGEIGCQTNSDESNPPAIKKSMHAFCVVYFFITVNLF